ncbi:plastocyanin/azurin family copper-binding protein [Solirubrobacter phytolaccae]|uniref:Plastocyanin/azurin family copper-binding protein n=1 Tax=Solirubrobacter phytolaccae TaxID=1404360 RepID=A0A9X3N6D7_9ACTN|nr:plastocyanin/azurin family copper-binding protein [Solirubrobacter phytolaccae]MDA0180598.1 plastocyanin/azurin family copper-binding protein [Solirubrobacter phytolaccae]
MRVVVPFTAAALLAAALALPATASADVTIQAVDDVINNRWSSPEVSVKVGEKVTWSFAGTTLMHNVKSSSTNWSIDSPFAIAGPSVSQTFTAAGNYAYVCQLHAGTMTGVVKVTDESGNPAPPPPPPPLSEQPYANDTPPLAVYELRDTVAPKLDRVNVSRVRRGVRVRFRLSEDGKVAVRLTRGGRVVKTRTVEVDRGTGSVTVSGLRAGTYGVQVSAKDLAGNAASGSPSRARVTVR